MCDDVFNLLILWFHYSIFVKRSKDAMRSSSCGGCRVIVSLLFVYVLIFRPFDEDTMSSTSSSLTTTGPRRSTKEQRDKLLKRLGAPPLQIAYQSRADVESRELVPSSGWQVVPTSGERAALAVMDPQHAIVARAFMEVMDRNIDALNRNSDVIEGNSMVISGVKEVLEDLQAVRVLQETGERLSHQFRIIPGAVKEAGDIVQYGTPRYRLMVWILELVTKWPLKLLRITLAVFFYMSRLIQALMPVSLRSMIKTALFLMLLAKLGFSGFDLASMFKLISGVWKAINFVGDTLLGIEYYNGHLFDIPVDSVNFLVNVVNQTFGDWAANTSMYTPFEYPTFLSALETLPEGITEQVLSTMSQRELARYDMARMTIPMVRVDGYNTVGHLTNLSHRWMKEGRMQDIGKLTTTCLAFMAGISPIGSVPATSSSVFSFSLFSNAAEDMARLSKPSVLCPDVSPDVRRELKGFRKFFSFGNFSDLCMSSVSFFVNTKSGKPYHTSAFHQMKKVAQDAQDRELHLTDAEFAVARDIFDNGDIMDLVLGDNSTKLRGSVLRWMKKTSFETCSQLHGMSPDYCYRMSKGLMDHLLSGHILSVPELYFLRDMISGHPFERTVAAILSTYPVSLLGGTGNPHESVEAVIAKCTRNLIERGGDESEADVFCRRVSRVGGLPKAFYKYETPRNFGQQMRRASVRVYDRYILAANLFHLDPSPRNKDLLEKADHVIRRYDRYFGNEMKRYNRASWRTNQTTSTEDRAAAVERLRRDVEDAAKQEAERALRQVEHETGLRRRKRESYAQLEEERKARHHSRVNAMVDRVRDVKNWWYDQLMQVKGLLTPAYDPRAPYTSHDRPWLPW